MNNKTNIKFMFSELVQIKFLLEDEEIASVVSDVMFKYFECECFYKKLLRMYKDKTNPSFNKDCNKDVGNLKVQMNEVRAVLNFCGITFDEKTVERIFGSEDGNYSICSIKKMRDRFVHNSNEQVIRMIVERKETMIKDLDYFLSLFN